MLRKWNLFFLVFFPAVLAAQGPLDSFITGSGAEDNGLICELILSSELDEALRYGRLLGEREETFVGDILTGLLPAHNGPDRHVIETIMGTIIDAVFFDGQGRPLERVRKQNQDGLLLLQNELAGFTDSHLKASLIYLLPSPPGGAGMKVLLRQGVYCLELAREHGGNFPGETPVEVLAFFQLAAGTSSPQLGSMVEEIYRVSRDRAVTAAAKECLKRMERNR